MKAKHGYRFISKIPKEDADILGEFWKEHTIKDSSGKLDRATNISYVIPELGKVVISHSNGSITINTHNDKSYVESFFKRNLPNNAWKLFKDSMRCSEGGIHFPKFHGTIPLIIETLEATEVPVWVSVRSCDDYADIHVKIMTKKATLKFPSNKEVGHTSSPAKRHYLSEKEIIEFVKKRISVKTSDYNEIGYKDRSSFFRRLEKISNKYDKIKRTTRYPAIYYYVEVRQ